MDVDGHHGQGDGDALPMYNSAWTSTASGDSKRVRGFIARRPSQASIATTISTISADSDDEDHNTLRVERPRKSVSKAKRASSSTHRPKV